MGKKILFICMLFVFMHEVVKAQKPKAIDTIYIRAYQETEMARFFAITDNQLSISFVFNVSWKLYGHQNETIHLSYYSPKKGQEINRFTIFIKEQNKFIHNKNYFTLVQFTKELSNNQPFRLDLPKKQLILLYGPECSNKVELYPVKVTIDLSSEG